MLPRRGLALSGSGLHHGFPDDYRFPKTKENLFSIGGKDMVLYITEPNTRVGINGGHIVLNSEEGGKEEVSKENVSAISFYGGGNITAEATRFFLENNIDINYYSQTGKLYGSLISNGVRDVKVLKQQIDRISNLTFRMEIIRRIIGAKIMNQITLIRKYCDKDNKDIQEAIEKMSLYYGKVQNCEDPDKARGYEGIASKHYFKVFSILLKSNPGFAGRKKRPAKDPVNALLNMGYSMLSREISGVIEARGLCAYAGFMHADRAGHASLASDLIEEWRPVIVDRVVLSMVRGNEICDEDYSISEESCILSKECIRKFILKLEKKMYSTCDYLEKDGKATNFRQAIGKQVDSFASALITGDTSLYRPVRIR